MKQIVIVGGGISGLACAFDLLNSGFDIKILESNSICGGQSRSEEINGVNVCYSWRIFTTHYNNFLDIMSKIPFGDKTIKDNFIPTNTYRTGNDNEMDMYLFGLKIFNVPKTISDNERNNIKSKLISLIGMSNSRIKSMDSITFFDYINPKSVEAISYIDHIVGPFLGLESRNASVYCVATMLQAVYINASGLVPNAPFQKAIFNPWVDYLRNNGVKIITNTKVDKIEKDGVIIDNEKVKADEIVLCVDQLSLLQLTKNSPSLIINNINEFAEKSTQLYFSFELLIKEDVDFKYDVFTVKSVNWLPIVERWNKYWNCCIPKGYSEQWNIAVLDKLKYKGKSISECTPNEIVNFTLEQMRNSDMFHNVKLKDGRSLWDATMEIRLFPHWKYINGKLINTDNQYKISFNAGCFGIAPNMLTNISNVYIGSVIAKHYPIVSQESATFNGRQVAKYILQKYDKKYNKIYYPKDYFNFIPVKFIDTILFNFGVSPIIYNEYSFMTVNILIIFILIFCIWWYFVKK